MRNNFLKIKILLLAVLFVSFISCEGVDMVSSEYDYPHATYDISGRVVDSNDNPIEGIQIKFKGFTLTTDSNGEWNIDNEILYYFSDDEIEISDIDGADNGEFQDKVLELTLDKITNGIMEWDYGLFRLANIEIVLDEI